MKREIRSLRVAAGTTDISCPVTLAICNPACGEKYFVCTEN